MHHGTWREDDGPYTSCKYLNVSSSLVSSFGELRRENVRTVNGVSAELQRVKLTVDPYNRRRYINTCYFVTQ
jgi:hypothetical protein